ncbi:MAG: hypothetical protein A2016_08690 [Elusimicrobia bacterium GWF2_62_30]|nr:MAG: hypothetical protein A2016_08690 [Elusimicrobia bacterium GWF2_62_30]
MKKSAFIYASLAAVLALQPLSAFDFGLPKDVRITVPSAPPPSSARLLEQYAEYYSALTAYSDKAFSVAQDSADFYDAQARGTYLRGRVEDLSAAIIKLSASDPCVVRRAAAGLGEVNFTELLPRLPGTCGLPMFRKPDGAVVAAWVTKGVAAELENVFGAQAKTEGDNGAIKAGYCRINYVKNNVPFLVQYDGFLKKGEVILTFDDGPGALTEEVSAAMKAGNAPSLFFVLGRNLGTEGKKRIKAEAADGHSVGVHGYYHATENEKPFTAYSVEKILSQLDGVASSISGATGSAPKFFRPPYGIISPDALRAIASDLDLVPVGWTIDTLDWSTKDPDALYANTISMIRKRGKGIVLMHDIHAQSRTASIKLVKWLAENGYKVVSPDRLAEAFKAK